MCCNKTEVDSYAAGDHISGGIFSLKLLDKKFASTYNGIK